MSTPRLSVVIPAHNEAAELPATLDNLRAGLAGTGPYEMIVVDNASTDATAAMAQAHGARVVHEGYRQISRARNTGAAATTGKWLLFVDADTWPSAALLAEALMRLEVGACGGGALVAFDRGLQAVYRYGLRGWNALARRFSLAAGCFVFVRRDAFESIGGFDERLYAGEEVVLSRRLRRWGRGRGCPFVLIESPPVLTSARKAEWFTPAQHLATLMLVLLCPWALRWRRLMWFWYRRP